jgi:glycosyltransferase involved in cell wall biosynthesis
MSTIAIVTPWFGADLTGGAEQQAFQVATRLAARGYNVDVLSTCNRSFHSDWTVNHHAAGASSEHGLTLRRFPVDSRDAAAFDRVNAKLLALDPLELRPGVNPVPVDDARTFINENIKSAALLDYLRNEGHVYQAFIFLPYMFAPIMLGAGLVSDRSWLQPCLHDEAQAYLPQTAEMFRGVRALLFNSEGERELALRLYGPGLWARSHIVGEGIEEAHYKPEELAAALPAELRGARFVLYLGRRDEVKNVDLLARAFANYKASHESSQLKLVLAGAGAKSFASDIGVHDLGLVSDEVKAALLAQCAALAQPSRNESFSRAIMEAWAAGRPVAAHGECLATAIAVQRADAGWTPATEVQWTDLFVRIAESTDEELNEIGARGRAYADEQADWDKVIARYESLLNLTPREDSSKVDSTAPPVRPLRGSDSPGARAKAFEEAPRAQRAIHQMLPDIVYGDAISNQACAIRDYLRRHNYASEIFVKRREGRMAAEAQLFNEVQPEPSDYLIYHHSIGSELTAFAIAHEGPKCLVYHNVTPAEFYASYRPGFSWMLETGRAGLGNLAAHFPISVGDSDYNAAELRACGFRKPGVLPIIVDPNRWNMAPDEQLMRRLQDGLTNLLFVGRVAPNKKQDRLVEAFSHYRALNPDSRLIIAGEGRASDPYFHHLLDTIARLNLTAHVEVTGQIEDAALLAYYRTAHLYWSPSEHEGFGAPLVEAMWFDVPVLALSATAVPETMGDAGVLYPRTEQLSQVAELAYRLTQETEERRAVINAQRLRRLAFTPEGVWPVLARLIDRVTSTQEVAAGAQGGGEQVFESYDTQYRRTR